MDSQKPVTIWGLPVVEVPASEPPPRIVFGPEVIRQDVILEWEEDHWVVRVVAG